VTTDEKRPSWWSLALAASGGTAGGIFVGGATALLAARVVGLDESIADYGSPFYMAIGGAWLLGLLGCYLALRCIRDSKAIPTVGILALLLPSSAVIVDPLASVLSRWISPTFGTLVTVATVFYVLLPLLSPIVARSLAAIVPWKSDA
jgi:hypothetical protein